MEGWGGVAIMVALGVGFGAVNVALSYFAGPRHPTPEKEAAYECGMPPVGDARERQSVKFYLIAMLFIIFDIETVFMVPWAVAFQQFRELGGVLFIEMLTFVLILAVGYVYIWKRGALQWD